MSEQALTAEDLLRHRDRLRRIARDLISREAPIDDVVQQTWVTALGSPPAQGNLGAWLKQVARNAIRSMQLGDERRLLRERAYHDQRLRDSSTTDPAEIQARMELVQDLVKSLRELREPYRTSVYLRYYEGLTPPQMAQRLEVPLQTVKTRLRRGLQMLREELQRKHEPSAIRRGLAVFCVPGTLPLAKSSERVAGRDWSFQALAGAIAVAALGFFIMVGRKEADSAVLPSLDEAPSVLASNPSAAVGSASEASPLVVRRALPPRTPPKSPTVATSSADSSPAPVLLAAPARLGFMKRAASEEAAVETVKPVTPDGEEYRELLESIIPQQMLDDSLPGSAVAVVDEGRIAYLQGYGVADLETESPVDAEETLFRIGSISKAVSAIGVLAAVDQGLLSREADVNTYLEQFHVDTRFDSPVTIDHLMTHTAGFDQVGTNRLFYDPAQRVSLGDFLERDLRRVRPPGRESCYDTYGISLLGYLLEARLDVDYGVAMTRLVFEPLGMSRSFVEVPDDRRDELATGYGFTAGRHVRQGYEYYASLPASSIDSTASDMARLLVALSGDGSCGTARLFSSEMANQLRTSQFRAHPEIPGFSFGFWEEMHNGQRVLQHGGTMQGYSGDFFFLPGQGKGAVVLMNRDGETGPRPRLAWAVTRALMNHWFPEGRTSIDVDRPRLEVDTAAYTGTYVGNLFCHGCPPGAGWEASRFTEVTSVEPGQIEIWDRSFEAVDQDLFLNREQGRWVFFTRSESGQVTSFADSYSSPGNTYEKVGERLRQEALGEAPRTVTELDRAVTRVLGDWESLRDLSERSLDSAEPGSFEEFSDCLIACESAAALGDLAPTEEFLDRGLGMLEELAVPEFLKQRLRGRLQVCESMAHAVAGDLDQALMILEEMADEDPGWTLDSLQWQRGGPLQEALGGDPRLQQLVERIERAVGS